MRAGKLPWRFAGDDRICVSPISFLSNGKRHVSMPVGNVLATFSLNGK